MVAVLLFGHLGLVQPPSHPPGAPLPAPHHVLQTPFRKRKQGVFMSCKMCNSSDSVHPPEAPLPPSRTYRPPAHLLVTWILWAPYVSTRITTNAPVSKQKHLRASYDNVLGELHKGPSKVPVQCVVYKPKKCCASLNFTSRRRPQPAAIEQNSCLFAYGPP